MAQQHTVWGIRAGKTGDAEALFDKHDIVAIGWVDAGDLSLLKTRDEFKAHYEQTYPGSKPMTVAVSAGQLYRFVREMKAGDAVVFPLKGAPEIWLGQVTGNYEYNPKLSPRYPNIRKVKWLKKHPRTKFSQGALYEIGSAMTLFQVRNYADEFLAALEAKDFQPPTEEEEEEAIGLRAHEIERQAHDFVLKQIGQNLKGHGLAEFVGHLLNLMGYKAKLSPPGPDRGIDIIASKDDLGVEQPALLVQVKSGDAEVSESEVQRLYGNVTDQEFGLFISLGGFKGRARDFAFGKHNLKLVDGDELVQLVYKYYDRLDPKYKGMIPLRRVFIPEALRD